MAGAGEEVNLFVDGMIDLYIEQHSRSLGTIEFDSLESIQHTFMPQGGIGSRIRIVWE
jgi:hypothetical protein